MEKSRKSRKRRSQPTMHLDSSSKFERLLKNASAIQHYTLRLYITGTTARSAQAVANIRALCEEFLHDRYDLEVVDLYQQPGQAADQQIIAAPTLVKERPIPTTRLVGDMSDRERVIVTLNLGGPGTDRIKAATK